MKRLTVEEKRLVNTAWRQLERFINDWKHSPCEWDNEIDVQVELASRLKRAYGKLNDYDAQYDTVVVPKKKQCWSRVSCEPRIYYTDSDNVRRCSKPDIVVFKDLEKPEQPPDDYPYPERKNKPILWLCEIKYNTEATPTNKLTDVNRDGDSKKIRYYLKDREVRYACWLVISRRGDTAYDEHCSRTGRFRKYHIKLPLFMVKKRHK